MVARVTTRLKKGERQMYSYPEEGSRSEREGFLPLNPWDPEQAAKSIVRPTQPGEPKPHPIYVNLRPLHHTHQIYQTLVRAKTNKKCLACNVQPLPWDDSSADALHVTVLYGKYQGARGDGSWMPWSSYVLERKSRHRHV